MVERYRCADCGAVFTEPDERTWTENHGEGMRERWLELLCPECGSIDIDEICPDLEGEF